MINKFEIKPNVLDYCLKSNHSIDLLVLPRLKELLANAKPLPDVTNPYRPRERQDHLDLIKQMHTDYQLLNESEHNARKARQQCKTYLEQIKMNLNIFSLIRMHDINFATFCHCADNILFHHLTGPAKSEIFLQKEGCLERLSKDQLKSIAYSLNQKMIRLEVEYENISTLVHRISNKMKIICDNLKAVYKASKKFRNIDTYFAQMNIEGLSNLPNKNRKNVSRYLAAIVTLLVITFYVVCWSVFFMQ